MASQSHASDSPSPGERRYRMIAVKGPGDRLQDSQRRFFEFCTGYRMPAFVCQVRGRESVIPAHTTSTQATSGETPRRFAVRDDARNRSTRNLRQ
jgi:VRR-NUC domain